MVALALGVMEFGARSGGSRIGRSGGWKNQADGRSQACRVMVMACWERGFLPSPLVRAVFETEESQENCVANGRLTDIKGVV